MDTNQSPDLAAPTVEEDAELSEAKADGMDVDEMRVRDVMTTE